MIPKVAALAVASMLAGCATWNHMDRQEKGAAVGATGGAIVGAAVGGPVGAAVGAAAGGYTGHYETKPGGLASKNPAYGPLENDHGNATAANGAASADMASTSPEVRDAQRALHDRGFNVAVDGIYGPSTEQALRDFQRQQGLQQTGQLDQQTLSALGVSNANATGGMANDNRSNLNNGANDRNPGNGATNPAH
jgi:peptidoglycan hydrolase-like protein with peptidoglycan-binding domain